MGCREDKIVCRRADRSDVPKITGMIRCRTLELFDDVTHPEVIFEKACLAVVQENQELEIISAMFLCNYPNVSVILEAVSPTWMNNLYDLENATAINTLFVHFLVWDDRYERDFFGELLTSTFYEAAFCDYVVLVLPAGIESENVIRREMTRIVSKIEFDEVKAQVLYVSDQSKRIPRMKYRLAVEEDNDDIIQILDSESKLLRQLYGEFYISEMMRHPLDSRRIIVSEREDSSISAIVCLNGNVDVDLLTDKFDLEAFTELRKIRSSFDEYNRGEYSLSVSRVEASKREFYEESNSGSDAQSLGNCTGCGCEEYVPDAFALELLGTQRPTDEIRCQGLLSAGFECFPELNYCVLLVPSNRAHFPFLDYFVRVPLKPAQDFPMALYATHRSVLQGDLQAREARYTDHEAVARLLGGISNKRDVLRDFHEASERNDDRRCFVFTCDELVVGLAIVCVEEEVDRLRRYYRVEDLSPRLENANLDCCSGRLLRFELMPIFNSRFGFFLAEIMRLAGFQTVYRREEFKSLSDDCTTVLPSCLSVMQPVEPRIRKFPEFQRFHAKENVDLPFDNLFSLFAITPRLTMTRREIVNAKIVVVGASDCGLAFIDALASGYKYRGLKFSEITLISRNGLPYEESSDYSVRIMTPFRGRYCRAYRKLTPGKSTYNVIKGTVIAIDRDEQCVLIENSVSVRYDYLVLTCGLPFQRPELEESSSLETPANCFLINDDVEARNCLMEIRRMTADFTVKQSIVFYGCNIECYCALATFLELGLEGSWITLIEPKILSRDDVFRDDSEVKDALREALASNGVRVVSDCDLNDWTTVLGSGVVIKSLRLERNEEIIECDALVSFQNKRPCSKTFLAISRAGLVFDGRLVIDAEFRTNDRHVFAAGTMTKYSRKLGISNLPPHEHYNSLEVGEKLAEKLVCEIASDNEDLDSRSNLPGFYSFQEPLVVSCLLPGGYRYLHVRKPGVWNTKESDDQTEFDKEPRVHVRDDVFTSGSCTADIGYFRLRLNQFRTVECVTCFGKTDFDIQNMISLYGKREAMLNDLKRRFLNSEIENFFAYFSEPWATALFSDDFDEFRKKRKCLCSDVKTDCRQILRNYLTSALTQANYEEISELDRDALMSECLEKSCYLQEIEDSLIEFLERHEDELPMYKTSWKERQILREIQDTPLVYSVDYTNAFASHPREKQRGGNALESWRDFLLRCSS